MTIYYLMLILQHCRTTTKRNMKSRQEKKHKEHKKNTKIKRAQRTTRCQKVDQMRQEGATLRRMTKNKKKTKAYRCTSLPIPIGTISSAVPWRIIILIISSSLLLLLFSLLLLLLLLLLLSVLKAALSSFILAKLSHPCRSKYWMPGTGNGRARKAMSTIVVNGETKTIRSIPLLFFCAWRERERERERAY